VTEVTVVRQWFFRDVRALRRPLGLILGIKPVAAAVLANSKS